ncbi:MAG: hypothetical protein HQ556_14515 [Candidatus Marinimicrobia bacterium]|nr:hypothetical protein [Candidatus Neomarinimicrobiota bacterium]
MTQNSYDRDIKDYEAKAIVRFLRGEVYEFDPIPDDTLKILQELHIFPPYDVNLEKELEVKNLDSNDPQVGNHIENAIWTLHDELQERLIPIIRHARDSNPDLLDFTAEDLIIYSSERFPYQSDQSYKISYLFKEYASVLDRSPQFTNKDPFEYLGDLFRSKYNVYRACLLIATHTPQRMNHDDDKNFGNMYYISESDPKRFNNRVEVAIFIRALLRSKYLFIFAGTPIEARINVHHLFEDDNYYVEPCDNCPKSIFITNKYLTAEFNHQSDPRDFPGKAVWELIKMLDDLVNSGKIDQLLPKCLGYKRPKKNSQTT